MRTLWLLSLLSVAFLCFSLSGCGADDSSEKSNDGEPGISDLPQEDLLSSLTATQLETFCAWYEQQAASALATRSACEQDGEEDGEEDVVDGDDDTGEIHFAEELPDPENVVRPLPGCSDSSKSAPDCKVGLFTACAEEFEADPCSAGEKQACLDLENCLQAAIPPENQGCSATVNCYVCYIGDNFWTLIGTRDVNGEKSCCLWDCSCCWPDDINHAYELCKASYCNSWQHTYCMAKSGCDGTYVWENMPW